MRYINKMKHIKKFNESLCGELEDIKVFMIELVQDWDIYWTDSIYDVDENDFSYNVGFMNGRYDDWTYEWEYLVDIFLPNDRNSNVRENIDNFLRDVYQLEKRLKTIYDKVEVRDINLYSYDGTYTYRKAPQIQILIT